MKNTALYFLVLNLIILLSSCQMTNCTIIQKQLKLAKQTNKPYILTHGGGGIPPLEVWCGIQVQLTAFNYYGYVYKGSSSHPPSQKSTHITHIPPCERNSPLDTTAILSVIDKRIQQDYIPQIEVSKNDTLKFGNSYWIVSNLIPPFIDKRGIKLFGYIELELINIKTN